MSSKEETVRSNYRRMSLLELANMESLWIHVIQTQRVLGHDRYEEGIRATLTLIREVIAEKLTLTPGGRRP